MKLSNSVLFAASPLGGDALTADLLGLDASLNDKGDRKLSGTDGAKGEANEAGPKEAVKGGDNDRGSKGC